MENYFSVFTGTPFYGILLAVLFLFGCRGIGCFLLKKFSCDTKGFAIPSAIGMNAAAWGLCILTFLKVPFFSKTFFLLFLGCGLFMNLKYRGFGKFLILPFAAIVFLLGNALAVPSGWDECVYQLAVPMRWAARGNWAVFNDLPYSGFPLLPQFIYRELIICSGLCSAKAFSILILGVCGRALCEHFSSKGNRIETELFSLLFFLSPIVFVLGSGTYSEAFIALDFICAIFLLRKEKGTKPFVLCGLLLAGPAAAVKLTGLFAAAAILIYGYLKKKIDRKTFFFFAAGAAVFMLPFYLRPLIAVGNPCWPYLGAWFSHDPATVEMSAFHHAIGNAGFGTDSAFGIFAAPFLLALPGDKALFDGFFGLPLLLIIPFLLYYTVYRRKRLGRFLPGIMAGLFLYLSWYFTAPQCRFLLPAYLLILVGFYSAVQLLPKRRAVLFMIVLAGLALFSLKDEVFWRNTLTRFERWKDPVNLFYSETHDELLPLIDLLHREPQKKTMLVFEERTLYFPKNTIIATPFFQSCYFTPPEQVTPEKILLEMKKANADQLYFRIPGNDPDLSKPHLLRCENFFAALAKLKMKRLPVGKTGFILVPLSD